MNPSLRRAMIFLFGLLVTFIVLRVSLHLSPDSNLDIGPYNIHHLFSGLLLMTLSVIPLILHAGNRLIQDMLVLAFAVGLSMALDEWVYLIATDGSDAAYLLPVSFWGGVVVIGCASLYTLAIAFYQHKCAPARERNE